eukprot:237942_1
MGAILHVSNKTHDTDDENAIGVNNKLAFNINAVNEVRPKAKQKVDKNGYTDINGTNLPIIKDDFVEENFVEDDSELKKSEEDQYDISTNVIRNNSSNSRSRSSFSSNTDRIMVQIIENDDDSDSSDESPIRFAFNEFDVDPYGNHDTDEKVNDPTADDVFGMLKRPIEISVQEKDEMKEVNVNESEDEITYELDL